MPVLIDTNIKILNNTTDDDANKVASSGSMAITSDGIIYTVYVKINNGRRNIFCAKSLDKGQTWTDKTDISEATAAGHEQYSPSIVVDSDNNLHVVWSGITTGQDYYILRYRKFNGSSWETIQNVTIATISSLKVFLPSIAIDSNNYLHVIYYVSAGGALFSLYYIKYTDSWQSPVAMSGNCRNGFSIAIDSNDYIHIVFGGLFVSPYNKICIGYRKYTDSWQSIIVLADGEAAGAAYINPSIAIDSNNYLHVTFSLGGAVRYKKYTDSWSGLVTLGSSYASDILCTVDSNDHIYVIFHRTLYTIYLFYNDGSSWSGPTSLVEGGSHKLTNTKGSFSYYPVINGIRSNIMETGYLFTYIRKWYQSSPYYLYFYSPADIEFPTLFFRTIQGVQTIQGIQSIQF